MLSTIHPYVYTAPLEEIEVKNSPFRHYTDNMRQGNSRQSTRFPIAFETVDHDVTNVRHEDFKTQKKWSSRLPVRTRQASQDC